MPKTIRKCDDCGAQLPGNLSGKCWECQHHKCDQCPKKMRGRDLNKIPIPGGHKPLTLCASCLVRHAKATTARLSHLETMVLAGHTPVVCESCNAWTAEGESCRSCGAKDPEAAPDGDMANWSPSEVEQYRKEVNAGQA